MAWRPPKAQRPAPLAHRNSKAAIVSGAARLYMGPCDLCGRPLSAPVRVVPVAGERNKLAHPVCPPLFVRW